MSSRSLIVLPDDVSRPILDAIENAAMDMGRDKKKQNEDDG